LGLRIVYRRLCRFRDNNRAIASSDPARVNVRMLVAIVTTGVEFIFQKLPFVLKMPKGGILE
jgi:hypothetical protein